MAQLIIDTGAAANDGTGDPLRTAFTETNTNFTAIFTAGPVDSNVRITDNTILTLNTNGNLVLAPNGVGKVVSNVDIVPNSSNIRNLGSTTARWSTVYSQYLDVSNSTTFAGNVTVSGNVTGAYILGDGSQLTNLPAGDYGNANVAAYLPTYTGNLSANNVAVTNDINISGSGDIVMTNGKINTSRIRSIGETGQDLWLEGETVVTIRTDEGGSDYDWTFGIDGNLSAPGAISAMGNISAGNVTANNVVTKKSQFFDQDEEVSLGLLTFTVVSNGGRYLRIKSTGNYTAWVDSVTESIPQGEFSLTTSFQNFPNSTLNPPYQQSDFLIVILSENTAYRVTFMGGAPSSSPYNNNFITIEKLL